jgi:hypothetical protein
MKLDANTVIIGQPCPIVRCGRAPIPVTVPILCRMQRVLKNAAACPSVRDAGPIPNTNPNYVVLLSVPARALPLYLFQSYVSLPATCAISRYPVPLLSGS